MKNTCCSCLCGNIQIRGNLCEQNKFHNFKQVEQQQKSKKKALFSLSIYDLIQKVAIPRFFLRL